MSKMIPIGLAALVALGPGCQDKVASVQQTSFFERSAMDTSVAAGDDFFQYANGAWLKTATIPDDYSSWGSFTTLYDENLKKLRSLLEELGSKEQAKGTLEQKAGDYYASGMDTAAIEKLGVAPIKPLLDRIGAVRNHSELVDQLAAGFRDGDGDLIEFWVGADEKNSAVNIANFYQSGTTLPEKGYYTRSDSATRATRAKLLETATRYFELAGNDKATAERKAAQVLALETKISATHRTPVELRDPARNYNKMSVGDLSKIAPGIDWKKYFGTIGRHGDSVNVGQPDYLKGLSQLLASEPIDA